MVSADIKADIKQEEKRGLVSVSSNSSEVTSKNLK